MNARATAIADDVEEIDTAGPTLRETLESARDEIAAREDLAAAVEPGDAGEASGTETALQSPDDPQIAASAVTQQAAGDEALLAPGAWTPAGKAKWSSLPADIRSEISRREGDMQRALAQHDEHREFGRQFAQISHEHADTISRAGVPPLRMFQDIIGIMKTLGSSDPQSRISALRTAALQSGFDVRALAGPPPPAGTQSNGSEFALAPLMQVAQEWDQFKGQQARQAEEQQQRQHQQTMGEVAAFRSKPEARFFDAVKDQMIALLRGGVARSLQDAYDQAIWTRPDIRAILSQEETQRQQAAQRHLRTPNARARGGSVRTAGGSPPPDRSLREELQANFAEARARV